MTEQKYNDKINIVFPEHPEPQASTSTAYDDDDEENHDNEQEEKLTISLEDYFEIIMMTSPVDGVKLYIPKYELRNAHVLTIQKPKTEPIHQEAP